MVDDVANADKDGWLRIGPLVETIRGEWGVSIGKAISMVIAAGASGEVRTRDPHKRKSAIPPHLWRDGIIDLENSKPSAPLIPRDGEKIHWPHMNPDDLWPWLEQHYPRSAEVPVTHEAASTAETTTRKSEAGHPEDYDWGEAELFAMQELESRGDFRKAENRSKDWRSQEDLVRAVVCHLDHLEKQKKNGDGGGPHPSTVRRRAPAWLEEFDRREPEQSARN